MDSLFSFAKENFQIITLLFGLLSVLIAVISLVYEIKAKKRKKAKEEKEAPTTDEEMTTEEPSTDDEQQNDEVEQDNE